MTDHQLGQIEVVNKLEAQVKNNLSGFSTVTPVADFENDPRTCLTSVHLPSNELKNTILDLTKPLKEKFPEHYYYDSNSLHLTVKNVRVINDPPHFTGDDIQKAKNVFTKVIPNHQKFNVYFYRLLLFPNNLALMGTTDPEFDEIFFDLDSELKKVGLDDDKKYINSKYFISNVTLARFSKPVSQEFKEMVEKISREVKIKPYLVDSVSLVTSNAVLKNLHVISTWGLK